MFQMFLQRAENEAFFHLCELGEQLWLHCFFLGNFLFQTPVLCAVIWLINTALSFAMLHKQVLDTAIIPWQCCRWLGCEDAGSEGFLLLSEEQNTQLQPELAAPSHPEHSWAGCGFWGVIQGFCFLSVGFLETWGEITEKTSVRSEIHLRTWQSEISISLCDISMKNAEETLWGSGLNVCQGLEVVSVSAFCSQVYIDVKTKSCIHLFYSPLQCLIVCVLQS